LYTNVWGASPPRGWFEGARRSSKTNEPDPPLLKRTEDFCTCSSQASVTSKPYFSLSCLPGGLLNSHMPSSALRNDMFMESNRLPSAVAWSAVGLGFMIGSLLPAKEWGHSRQNSNWKLNYVVDAPGCSWRRS